MDKDMPPNVTVVALPCYNEAPTIGKVVADFQKALPGARIYVFDNLSTDDSAELARQAGATVVSVNRQGKGHVMRAIFNKLDADAIIVADADDTYFADEVSNLVDPVLSGEVDMVVGNRLQRADKGSMVPLHRIGNWLIVWSINRIFGTRFEDVLSGYRVFSRRFVETVPVLTTGFEIETEMSLQALEEELLIIEIPISYKSRPQGSVSKLNSFRDGSRILTTAGLLLIDHHPMRIFGWVSLACWMIVAVAGVLRIANYLSLNTLPEALLTGLMLLFSPIAVMFFGLGLTLNSTNTRIRELKQIIHRNMRTDV